MPTVSWISKVKAVSEHCNLSLNVRHRLVAGAASEHIHALKNSRIPESINVVATNIVFSISGNLNGTEAPVEQLKQSEIGCHLVEQLRANASELGLSTVRDSYISNIDGRLKVDIALSRQLRPAWDTLPSLTLFMLDLNYVWKTSFHEADADPTLLAANNPFSRQISLPFLGLLDDVIGRFMTWHLVRNYPLIFGPWCRQLSVETIFFHPIYDSIINMMERSPHSLFRTQCARLLKLNRKRTINLVDAGYTRLSELLKKDGSVDIFKVDTFSTPGSDSFFTAMEYAYRYRMRRRLFKGTTRISCKDNDEDDLVDEPFLRPSDLQDLLVFEEPGPFDDSLSVGLLQPSIWSDSQPCSPSTEISLDTFGKEFSCDTDRSGDCELADSPLSDIWVGDWSKEELHCHPSQDFGLMQEEEGFIQGDGIDKQKERVFTLIRTLFLSCGKDFFPETTRDLAAGSDSEYDQDRDLKHDQSDDLQLSQEKQQDHTRILLGSDSPATIYDRTSGIISNLKDDTNETTTPCILGICEDEDSNDDSGTDNFAFASSQWQNDFALDDVLSDSCSDMEINMERSINDVDTSDVIQLDDDKDVASSLILPHGSYSLRPGFHYRETFQEQLDYQRVEESGPRAKFQSAHGAMNIHDEVFEVERMHTDGGSLLFVREGDEFLVVDF